MSSCLEVVGSPAVVMELGTMTDNASTVQMLKGELERTERAIRQLDQALSPQGIAMQAQLIHRAGDIRSTIARLAT